MITLKEYAKKHGISYEAVRKQVNRYREDLGEHLYKVERTQYIDEDGEAFLDQKRASNPVVVIEHDKDEQIEELKKQNEALRAKVVQLQDMIISRDAKVMELQDRLLLLTTKPDQELDSPRQQESVEKEEKGLAEKMKRKSDEWTITFVVFLCLVGYVLSFGLQYPSVSLLELSIYGFSTIFCIRALTLIYAMHQQQLD